MVIWDDPEPQRAEEVIDAVDPDRRTHRKRQG